MEFKVLKDIIKSKKLINEKWEMTFHENGIIEEISQMKNGKINGTRIIFFSSGKPSFVVSYKNNKKHGIHISTLSDGTIFYVCQYKNNKQCGVTFNDERIFELYDNGSRIFSWKSKC